MDDLISRQALYEKTAEWEAQALHMVEVYLHDEDMTEWRKWSAILKERTAFKHDVADAPSAERHGQWLVCNILDYAERPTGRKVDMCSECKCLSPEWRLPLERHTWNYCPNCGSRMDLDEVKE